MKVVVAGSSGLIGTALVEHLRGHGHEVVRLVRRTVNGPGEASWDPAAGALDVAVIDGADAVVNLAGAGIGDKRWTDEYRRELVDSRIGPTGLLARTIAAADAKPSVFLSGSAIGAYGSRGDEQLDETSALGSDFLAELCTQWEAAAAPAQDAGVRTAFVRTGIVLTPKGGALAKMLPLFRLGIGGRFGRGDQWQSWISLDDEVGAIEHLLTADGAADVAGPVDLTAPNPVRNREFARELGHVLHRPSLFPVPAFGPRLLLGRDLADALLFTGQRVLPRVLERSGYTFAHPTLDGALRSVLGR